MESDQQHQHTTIPNIPPMPMLLGTQPPHRRQLQNPISIEQMRDGVVDPNTYSRYVNEIIHFLNWLAGNLPSWMTELCSTQHSAIMMRREGEKFRQREKRIKAAWQQLVKNSDTEPLIHVDQMTPEGVMRYISSQANQTTGLPLSKSGYNGKRSAICHFVRAHWTGGWSDEFDTKLEQYWTGFIRGLSAEQFTARNRRKRAKVGTTPPDTSNDHEMDVEDASESDSDSENEGDSSEEEADDDEDDRDLFQEGKIAMTPELFRSVCRWFLEWRSVEGIFCACFVALTWHLACRSNNTAKIRYSHMSWLVFDAMHIRFRQTKSEKHGQARRYKRACYSNPFEWYIDLPLLLGMYFATNFNTVQRRGMRLFPGGSKSQSARVTEHFKRLLREHKDEVMAMGYDNIEELGLHSMRKGVTTYLMSLPGGPSAAAICRRAGWSLGHVKDAYIFQTQDGDEFVGRCASMLNMMNGDFASSPPFFRDTLESDLSDEALAAVFPHHHIMDGSKQLLNRCLAALVFHRQTILNLHPSHAARSISLYCQSSMHNALANHVQMVHSWETNIALTGIPPHIKLLVDMASVKAMQERLLEELTTKVLSGITSILDERQLGGGELTEGRVIAIVNNALQGQLPAQFDNLSQTLTQRLDAIATSAPALFESQEQSRGPTVNRQTFELRSHGNGILSRLPVDYDYPSAGVYDCWVKWNISDTERGIPPLRLLSAKDFAFINSKDKDNDDSRGHTGKYKAQRRSSSKTYSDLKFLCSYIEEQASARGLDVNDRSGANVRLMYETVQSMLYLPGKNGSVCTQNKWRTVVRKLRERVKEISSSNE